MRFTHQALHGLGDAQQNFEQLESLSILDRTVVFGTAAVTFSVANGLHSTIVDIPHKLGVVPQWYLGWLDVQSSGSNAQYTVQSTSAPDATNIHLWAITNTAPGGTFSLNIKWLVIG